MRGTVRQACFIAAASEPIAEALGCVGLAELGDQIGHVAGLTDVEYSLVQFWKDWDFEADGFPPERR